MEEFKAIAMGILKGVLYTAFLVFVYWLLTGMKELERLDIVEFLAVSAILKHFVDLEKIKGHE